MHINKMALRPWIANSYIFIDLAFLCKFAVGIKESIVLNYFEFGPAVVFPIFCSDDHFA